MTITKPQNLPLHGLSVLITRPLPQAQRLGDLIQAQGGGVLFFPTLEILPSERFLQDDVLDPNTSIFIFTSSNSVRSLPTRPNDAIVLSVGSGTAEALRQAGWGPVIFPNSDRFSSEGLLELPELQAVKSKRVAIFTGEEGREHLGEVLKKRGAVVELVHVYRRACPSVNALEHLPQWQAAGVNVIVSTSGASLRNLFELVDDQQGRLWLLQVRLLVISDRMRLLAEKLGFKHIVQAENATDQAIVEALSQMEKD